MPCLCMLLPGTRIIIVCRRTVAGVGQVQVLGAQVLLHEGQRLSEEGLCLGPAPCITVQQANLRRYSVLN